MDVVRYRCPNPKCRAVLSIPAKAQGRMVVCGRCGMAFLAPLSLRLPPAPPEARRKAG